MKTSKKGISLIVLIITIIVMIILASAIVLSLTSNNIVDRAKEATSSSDLANAKQLVMVAEAEWEMEIPEGYNSDEFKKYAETKLVAAGFNITGGTGSIEVTDDASVYIYPTVPKGFVASSADGENKVSTGLVIYQTSTPVTNTNVETARESYNQYVWIPVDNLENFERIEWNSGTPIKSTTSYNSNDALESIEYTKIKESVEKYGGFYMARYEAGKEGENTLVSKKNATVWNNIDFNESKTECKKITTDMIQGHLIYGEEWDAALNFISKTDPEYATDSTGKGNYTYKLLKAGFSDAYAKNNIYDMAGNVYEWTMEAVSADLRVLRGGFYDDSGTSCPASLRNDYDPEVSNVFFGFRLTLYIK